MYLNIQKYTGSVKAIGHFRVPLCRCFKASLSVKPFSVMKMTLICMRMKLHAELIFI